MKKILTAICCLVISVSLLPFGIMAHELPEAVAYENEGSDYIENELIFEEDATTEEDVLSNEVILEESDNEPVIIKESPIIAENDEIIIKSSDEIITEKPVYEDEKKDSFSGNTIPETEAELTETEIVDDDSDTVSLNAAGLTYSEYESKYQSFINDSRWENGVSWPQRSPKLSTYSCVGCYAYAADFAVYVYGNGKSNSIENCSGLTKFTSVSDIRTGDIIHTSNHWFIVLERDGNTLYTAEGAYSNKVRVNKAGYKISNGKLYQNSSTLMTFSYGFHYSFSNDAPTGSEMTSGYDRTIPDGDYLIANAGSSDKNVFYYLDIAGKTSPAPNKTNVSLCGPGSGEPSPYDVWTVTYNNGFYTIAQKGTNQVLDVTSGSTVQGTNVEVFESKGNSAQKWAISTNGKNGYRLQAKCSGMSLDVQSGKIANGENICQWSANNTNAQCWLFIPYKPAQPIANGRYILLTELDHSIELDVAGDTGSISNNTNVQVWSDSAASRYNSFDFKKLSNGYYQIIHAASGKALTVAGGSTTFSANICVTAVNNTNSQQWAVTKVNGKYALRSRTSGYAIDVAGGKTENGSNVVQWPFNSNTYQKKQLWTFVPAEYKVSYNANGGSSAPATQTKYYKTNLTLSSQQPVRSGYSFMGWSTSSGGTVTYKPGQSYNKDTDLTLYAVWKEAAKLKSIAFNKTEITLAAGSTEQLQLTMKPSNAAGENILFKISNPDIADIDSSLIIKAFKYGTTVITAYSSKDKSIKTACKVTVLFNDVLPRSTPSGKYTAIYWLAKNKIAGSAASFGINNYMTRGQFVRFLYRYAGEPKVKTKKNPFKDISDSYTHYDAILWAVEQGLIEGYIVNGKQVFKPEKALSRNNVATILWKFAGSPKVNNNIKPFSDVKKSTCIAWGKKKGIFTGITFKPADNCLRGDYAVYLYRYDRNVMR